MDKVRSSDEEMTMKVSGICTDKDGGKYAFVTFAADRGVGKICEAEGRIPECVIEKYQGFSEDEVKVLEMYMKSNLTQLKKMAANTNVMKAFMKGED